MSKREDQQVGKNCIPRNTLISYIEGKLSDREMNAVERHLSGCPMCSDELEGLQVLDNPQDIKIIEQKLNKAIDRKSSNTKSILYLTPLKIAASIIILIGISSIIYYTSTLNAPSRTMALNMDKEADAIDTLDESVEEEMMPITQREEEIKPPPPQQVQVEAIHIVDDDISLFESTELYETEFSEDIAINIIEFKEEEDVEEEEEEIFFLVEEMPTFANKDYTDFREYIAKNIKYPVLAAESAIEGKVYVKFIVELDGSLSNIEIVRSIDPFLDKEAIRVVKESPKWIPGKQRGKPVRVYFTFPVNFKLM